MNITQAKAELDTERERLTREYKERMAEELTPLRDQLEEAIVEAYTMGVSIASICRSYGTSARKTITDVLESRGVYKKGEFYGNR